MCYNKLQIVTWSEGITHENAKKTKLGAADGALYSGLDSGTSLVAWILAQFDATGTAASD